MTKRITVTLILIVVLLSVFLITRLVNLLIIPIFTDEAIYLRWGQIALSDPRWRFISLIDGKQPLLIWLFLPVLKLISDPLVAGRLVSIAAGFAAMTGFALFSWYLSRSIKAAAIGAIIYIFCPMFLVYDRLAIYESLLSALTVWTLFLTYIFGKKFRLDAALILGNLIGLGLLTKSSAYFFILLLPTSLLLMDWKERKLRQFGKWICFVLVILIQSQIYASILRLSEFRHIIAQKNLQFLYSFSEFIAQPFRSFLGNLTGLTTWSMNYLTWTLLIVIILANLWYFIKKPRTALFFGTYFLMPYMATALFGKIIYPRFILFMLIPLFFPTILFITNLLNVINRQLVGVLIGFLLLLPSVFFDWKLLVDPIHAPLPLADRQQFINDWPAGYGINEVVSYLQEAASRGKVVVGTEGTFGLFPMALELYLGKNPNIKIIAFWPVKNVPEELQVEAKLQPTFLVFKERQIVPEEWPLKLIAQYRRGDGPTFMKFYQVLP